MMEMLNAVMLECWNRKPTRCSFQHSRISPALIPAFQHSRIQHFVAIP